MRVKQIARRCFTQGQWDALARGKQVALRAGTALVVRLVRLLSTPSLIEIRTRLQLTGRMDYGRAEVLLYVDSPIEYQTRLHSCAKEPEMVQWIESFGKGQVFYDIGANVGAYSLLAAKLYGSDISVYSFEPAFPNFAQLCRNISLNMCQDVMIPLQIGLSDTTSVVDFNYSHLDPGSALHALGEPIDQLGEEFTPSIQLPVLSYRMDDLLRQFDLPVPDHIKMDVDGVELEILQGAEGLLKSPRVKDLMIEGEDGSEVMEKIVTFLRTKGFGLQEKFKYVLAGDTGKYAQTHNFLFSRNSQ